MMKSIASSKILIIYSLPDEATVFFLQGFGMSDHHHLNSGSDIAAIIIKELKENIENFEPRIEVTEIVNIADDGISRMSFSINCLMRDNNRSLKLFLDPVVGCSEVKS